MKIALFHSGLGLRPGIHTFADRLRAAGHEVHVPDLYDGEVFSDLADGVRKRDALGIPELARRATESVASLPADIVYAGFSLGSAVAAFLATTRPGARAAILMEGAPQPSMWGVDAWPAVPVQLHYADEDPWVTAAEVASLRSLVQASGVRYDEHTYRISGHLFADPELAAYDAAATDKLVARFLEFVA
jgi:dienelactone hydrolase